MAPRRDEDTDEVTPRHGEAASTLKGWLEDQEQILRDEDNRGLETREAAVRWHLWLDNRRDDCSCRHAMETRFQV